MMKIKKFTSGTLPDDGALVVLCNADASIILLGEISHEGREVRIDSCTDCLARMAFGSYTVSDLWEGATWIDVSEVRNER